MNDVAKIPSLAEYCRDTRADLHDDFCTLEMELGKSLGAKAPRTFRQKVEHLDDKLLAGIDSNLLVAGRNLIAHAEVYAVSRAGSALSIWQLPHCDLQLNARTMTRDEVAHWADEMRTMMKKLRAQLTA